MTFAWVLDERKYLSSEKVRILRKCCRRLRKRSLRQSESLGMRDWFMIETGLNTGLRVQELADLKFGDLHVMVLEASVIVRKGKGRKKRVVWINESFKKTCRSFQRWKHGYGHSIQDEAPVFTTEQGKAVTKRTLQMAFKRIMHEAGLESHYSIHCLRHTYATHLMKASGNNVRLIRDQLGHSSIKVSEIYVGLIGSEVKKALSKLYA